jgi:hypothetical protein
MAGWQRRRRVERLRRFVYAGALTRPHRKERRSQSDRSPDRASRSIARSQHQIGPIDRRIDRLWRLEPAKAGAQACTIRRWAEGLARLPHRLGRVDASAVCSPTQPHLTAEAHGRRARREQRARSVPAPLLAPPQRCLDGGRRSTSKAVLPSVSFARPCSRTATAALLGSCSDIGSGAPEPGIAQSRGPKTIHSLHTHRNTTAAERWESVY